VGRFSSGSPDSISRRSLPNASSNMTDGLLRRYARTSDARRPSTGGGAMIHASRPRRWIKKRAPDSTSSRILENERLASVAETRFSPPLRPLDVLSDLCVINQFLIYAGPGINRRACAKVVR
jgi:hypothetical protein